jgi:hypothetical protein
VFGCSENAIRRRYGTVARFKALARGNAPQDPADAPVSPVQEIRNKNEIERLRAKIVELEQETLTSDGLKRLIGVLDSHTHTPPDWLTPKAHKHGLTGVPTLMLSDLHFDEVVRPEEIGGVNSYNREIATKRIQHTVNQAITLLTEYMRDPNYDGSVLALGGDMLSGNIHDELTESNDATLNESIVALTDVLIGAIERFADAFGRVHVPCVTGNHGRMHKKPRAKHRAHHNFEWLIYQFLTRHFAGDKRVTFQIPDGIDCFYQIYNTRFVLEHGDAYTGGNGIGGIMVPIMRGLAKKSQAQTAMGQPFDVALIGHFHTLIFGQGVIINGSTKGYDEYSKRQKYGFEPSQQACFITHPEHGITYQIPIQCNGYEKKAAPAAPLTVW